MQSKWPLQAIARGLSELPVAARLTDEADRKSLESAQELLEGIITRHGYGRRGPYDIRLHKLKLETQAPEYVDLDLDI